MKKILLKLMFGVMLLSLLPIQVAQACSGFIVGKGLTADGSTLYGRTEDYPYPPDGGKHNQNYVVVPAATYKEGDKIEDESNGFTYPHLANEMKYTATYDAARGDGSNGNFGAHGFNEVGVSMTGTVSATPNDKVLKADPLVKDGLPEASMIDLVLPRAKTAREGIEIVAKAIEEKALLKAISSWLLTKKSFGIWRYYLVINMLLLNSQKTNMLFSQILTILAMLILMIRKTLLLLKEWRK